MCIWKGGERMKVKLLLCNSCDFRCETTAKNHTHRCCGERMHIFDWRLEGVQTTLPIF